MMRPKKQIRIFNTLNLLNGRHSSMVSDRLISGESFYNEFFESIEEKTRFSNLRGIERTVVSFINSASCTEFYSDVINVGDITFIYSDYHVFYGFMKTFKIKVITIMDGVTCHKILKLNKGKIFLDTKSPDRLEMITTLLTVAI